MATSGALDLGTTNVKAAALHDGRLGDVACVPAPALTGDGLVRTSDAAGYLGAIDACLARLPPGATLGVSTQRSSFVLFDAASGRPLTALVSWQDRRAASWCDARAHDAAWVTQRTGLPLSPHYAGPKLACLLAADPALRERLADGSARFGTLETWWLHVRGDGRPFETDASMAARTLLADPRRGTWDDDLLAFFGVPAAALPAIRPTAGRAVPLAPARRVAATVADQAAAALAVLGGAQDAALVNLGTGGFVLRGTGEEMGRLPGYLAGPLYGAPDGSRRYALEGTVNGIGEALARAGGAPAALPVEDPAPEAFCLPDLAGLGSPHWRPEVTLTYSPAAERTPPRGRGRLVLEGTCFRVREILAGLFPDEGPRRIHLSGGLAREPALPAALAACLGRPVRVLAEPEVTLVGAASLACGELAPPEPLPSRAIEPGLQGRYLETKYERWRDWLAARLRH